MTMRALATAALVALALAAPDANSQGAPPPARPHCDGACGVIQSIVPVTERKEWTPLGAVAPGSLGVAGLSGMSGTSTQMKIGPGFSNQGLVVLGSAGGAAYASRPNEYRRQRWEVTVKMDNGPPRVLSQQTEPLLVQEGDYVRVSGNSIELVSP
jgi:outer membrane lipoprotein SlyB